MRSWRGGGRQFGNENVVGFAGFCSPYQRRSGYVCCRIDKAIMPTCLLVTLCFVCSLVPLSVCLPAPLSTCPHVHLSLSASAQSHADDRFGLISGPKHIPYVVWVWLAFHGLFNAHSMRINWYLSDPDDDYVYAVWNLNSIIEKSKQNKNKYSMQKKQCLHILKSHVIEITRGCMRLVL